LGSLICT
jgi:23S rRNA (pseudouridine1915-N3)-methyltransferase